MQTRCATENKELQVHKTAEEVKKRFKKSSAPFAMKGECVPTVVCSHSSCKNYLIIVFYIYGDDQVEEISLRPRRGWSTRKAIAIHFITVFTLTRVN